MDVMQFGTDFSKSETAFAGDLSRCLSFRKAYDYLLLPNFMEIRSLKFNSFLASQEILRN